MLDTLPQQKTTGNSLEKNWTQKCSDYFYTSLYNYFVQPYKFSYKSKQEYTETLDRLD